MGRNTDKTNLVELFNQPCTCVQTRGTQEGIILKFHSFYLKIYDDTSEDLYIVTGYRYGNDTPIFCDRVHSYEMRDYASKF